MFQSRFAIVVIGVVFITAVGLYLEATGYRDFDTGRGKNLLCRVDSSCRAFTDAEVATAREVFGDAIDYNSIKIFDRPSYATIPAKLFLGFGGIAETPNGNIYYQDSNYYGDDIAHDSTKLSVLFHEMTHAWQYQHRSNLLLSAIREYVSAAYNWKALYHYDINDDKEFRQLGIEQQASVVEDYQTLRLSFRASRNKPEWLQHHCSVVLLYETKIKQALPVQPIPGCQTID